MRVFYLVIVAFLLADCSFVPPLSEATGSGDSGILIADIVIRVKCEIADSFEDLRPDPNFLWLRDWTVKVDLTLQINAQAGISPSGSYTTYQKNAFNTAAGSTSLTTNTIGSVSQFFSVAAGANFGEQAVRTEVVSFSLALDELHDWYETVREMERNVPPDRRVCDPGFRRELTGNLGLREWVLSAFFTVDKHALQAGNHPPPGTAKSTALPSAVQPPKPIPGVAAGTVQKYPPSDQLISDVGTYLAAVKAAAQAAQFSANSTTFTQQQINAELKAASKLQDTYKTVATEKILKTIASVLNTISQAANSANIDAARATKAAAQGQAALEDAQQHYDDFMDHYQKHEDAAYQDDRDALFADSVSSKTQQGNAQLFSDHAANLQKNVAQLSVMPDPPIDSILHSVQFVVSYGASVTPSWSLIAWKGPGLNAPGASAQGTRTNMLQLAFGSRNGAGTMVSQEQLRLIQNANLLAIRQ
jgi:hypothetical protein